MENSDEKIKTPGFTKLMTSDAKIAGRKWGLERAAKEYEATFKEIDEDYLELERMMAAVKAKEEDFSMLFETLEALQEKYMALQKQKEELETYLSKQAKLPIPEVRKLLQGKNVGGIGSGVLLLKAALSNTSTLGTASVASTGLRLASRSFWPLLLASTGTLVAYKYKQKTFIKAAQEEYDNARAKFEEEIAIRKSTANEKRMELSDQEKKITDAIFKTVDNITSLRMQIAWMSLMKG